MSEEGGVSEGVSESEFGGRSTKRGMLSSSKEYTVRFIVLFFFSITLCNKLEE